MKKPVSLLLFLVLPLGIFWLTGIAAINHRQKLLWSEAESKLNRQVETIINFLEPSSFMQNLFDNFTTELYSQEITPERLRDLTANYCNGNLKFEPCIFIDGSLLNEKQLCLDDLPITRIWEYMHDEKATEKDLFFHIKTKVRSRLGPLFSILKMKNHPRTVMEFSGKSGSGTIYYYPQNNQNGALLIAWKLPTPQTLEKYIPDSIKMSLAKILRSRKTKPNRSPKKYSMVSKLRCVVIFLS
jgi:hypothetical protein